jgi:MFS family permease
VLLNVFPGFLFVAIWNVPQAILVSVGVGLLHGFATICLFDLLMRACPKRLEGSGTMLGISAFSVASGLGDLLGSWLYVHGGFALCLILDATTTALVLRLLPLLPANLIAGRDGEQAGAHPAEAQAESDEPALTR